ncbi:hypothetical protein BMF77_04547 [Dolichospermum sp. UHCC 0315A]|jgi:hypothetical protein|nr:MULTISPECIES: hypothetical protein [unclassified Dolichospermum]QEI43921.1 hypothetical protein BMF77_04547 [Dolichospermum sp. UHCC 0315A]
MTNLTLSEEFRTSENTCLRVEGATIDTTTFIETKISVAIKVRKKE